MHLKKRMAIGLATGTVVERLLTRLREVPEKFSRSAPGESGTAIRQYLFQILDLLAHLFDQELEFHRRLRDFGDD